MVVGEDLRLDVPRALEVALDVDGVVGEELQPLALRGLEGGRRPGRLGHELHPLAAATGGCLDDQRVADLLADLDHALDGRTGSVAPGMIGTPAAFIAVRASVFEPISSIAAGGGPIHVSPASSTLRANAAFSARNP